MSYLISRIANLLTRRKSSEKPTNQGAVSIVGSWQLVSYIDSLGQTTKPRWKEVWSFAAMDDTETNGVYVCDYINLHSVVGKWFVQEDCIKLVRKECDVVYHIVELTETDLVLQNNFEGNTIESITFGKVF